MLESELILRRFTLQGIIFSLRDEHNSSLADTIALQWCKMEIKLELLTVIHL